ncbi:MAG: hypothetical protein RLZZ577_1054, partial [Bacteroidota bacterium]
MFVHQDVDLCSSDWLEKAEEMKNLNFEEII